MNKTLNELILLYKHDNHLNNVSSFDNIRKDLLDDSVNELIKNKIEKAKNIITNWLAINEENFNIKHLVFTGDIGSVIYDSIYTSLIEEKIYSTSFGSRQIKSNNDIEIFNSINICLKLILKLLNDCKYNLIEFEILLKSLKSNCNIVGAN